MAGAAILVVGATGAVGVPIVERLRRDGFDVRALVRNARRARERLGDDVELVEGTVEDSSAVRRAVRGCTGVHVSLAGTGDQLERVEHHGSANVAQAAAQEGVGLLAYVSGSLVHEPYGEKIPEHRAKLAAEQAIRRSGVPYVFFRPTYFMENLPRHIQGRLAVVLGRQARPLHMVAAEDFAAMVAKAFATPQATNEEFFVHGPEAVTIPAALRLYCSLVEPHKRVVRLPLGVMSAVDRLFMGGRLRANLELMGLLERLGERGDPARANELLGAPAMTVREWCEQRALSAASGRSPAVASGK